MHDSVLAFVAKHTAGLNEAIDVLDVGALDINGSARSILPAAKYVGVDLEHGPGVDLVADAHMLGDLLGDLRPADGFDVVLCLEELEHDTAPWLTVGQLARAVKPGGMVLVTARGNGFPLHNEPDCFRFMESGFRSVLEWGGLHVDELRPDPQTSGWLARCSVATAPPAESKPATRRKPKAGDG